MSMNSFQIFLTKAKGGVSRLQVAGDPTLQSDFHSLMTQGQFLEASPSDAIHYILSRQRDINEKISHYFDMVRLANDGQSGLPARAFLYAADAVHFISVVQTYVGELVGLANSLEKNLSALETMAAQMNGMVTQGLEALSFLIANICNWGLPTLASLPVLFGQMLWGFDSWPFFLFSGLHGVNFNSNFSFGQCRPGSQPLDIFGAFPALIKVAGSGYSLGTQKFHYPLGGSAVTPAQQSNPELLAAITDVPLYDPTAFTSQTVQGSLPNPSAIVSGYLLTPENYAANVLSSNETVANALYSNGVAVGADAERTALRQLVTLDQIVANDYDPNLVAIWLLSLDAARGTTNSAGRSGQWIVSFQEAYNKHVQPSVVWLQTQPVPWNSKASGPSNLPIITELKSDVSNSIHWQLSYIEASLLGYDRSTAYDGGADTLYLSSYTGADLDYKSLTIDSQQTDTVMLGLDTASYPSTLTYPVALKATLFAVIDLAVAAIAVTPNYKTSDPRFLYTFDEYAQPQVVDRFSQFWREFAANVNELLATDSYTAGFVTAYTETFDGAVNPLAASVNSALYQTLTTDCASRNRQWQPGEPLLPIAVVPQTALLAGGLAAGQQSGWSGNDFDSATFLARPDIQALPVPVQVALLRTNQSYAALMAVKQTTNTALQDQIAQTQQAIASIESSGFEVQTNTSLTVLGNGTATPIPFQVTVFDHYNFVTSQETFTVKNGGDFVVAGTIHWTTVAGTGITVQVVVNGGTVIATQTSAGNDGATDQTFSVAYKFNAGDTFQVVAQANATSSQTILSGSELYCIAMPASQAISLPGSSSSGANGEPQVFTVAATIAAGQAVSINSSGQVVPLNPTVAPPTPVPYCDGVALAAAAVGQQVPVATAFGGVFQLGGMAWTTGGVLYVGPTGALTQDFTNTVQTSCRWVVVAGRALSADTFLLQPHLPNDVVINF